MKVSGNCFLVLISTVFIGWRTQNVNGASLSLYLHSGLLTFNFIFVTSSFTEGPSKNFSFPHHEIPGHNSSKAEKRIRSSLRRRVVRQFGFIAPALQTMGCLPKLFCGLNAKEPSDTTSTVNDLSYLMKFAFSDQLDDLEDDEKKGKDGHKDEEELSEESLQKQKIQEQILEDQANEELIYDDPQYLSYIWKDMMKKENKMKKEQKKKRKPKSLELELDILLKTLEIDKNFGKFSTRFQKFRDIFQSNRQSRSQKIQEDPSFNATEYIQRKNLQLNAITDDNKKLEVAIEAGAKLRSGRQCRLLFSSCPYSVEQMKEMLKTSNKTQTRVPPNVKDPYDGVPLKKRPVPLHVTDPLQSYMTDDVYIENLDSEHQFEIQREEVEKLKEKQKKRPQPISVTVPPTSTYDEDAQLLYLMLPESEIELQQKHEAEMQAASQAGKIKIKSNEDDEANDQIIPQIQVEYTEPEDNTKEAEDDRSTEEVASLESQEMATDQSPESFGLISLDSSSKGTILSKEENHDDENSVVKEEKKYMTTTKRPRFKYRIKNKNKQTEDEDGDNEESSVSEQEGASDEQEEAKHKKANKGKLKTGSTSTNSKITPLPPIFGEVKDTTESSTDYTTSTSSQRTTTEDSEESDEGPSILPSKFRRPYPFRGNKPPHQHIIAQDDEKEVQKEPPRIPFGPIVNIGGNPHKYQVPPLPAPPPIYSKLPNSHKMRPEPPPRPNKKQPSSILSSILNFKIVAPNKPPKPRPGQRPQSIRPGQRPQSVPGKRPEHNQPQRPQSSLPQRPHGTINDNKDTRREPFRRPSGPMSILSLGGIKNAFSRPSNNVKRPLPPPPPIYNGKHPQNHRPFIRNPPKTAPQPIIEHTPPNSDGISSEENESNGDEADKSTEQPQHQNFNSEQLPQLGDPVPEQKPPSQDVPPPPIFGMVEPNALNELLINAQVASQPDENEQDDLEDLKENNAPSAEKAESDSSEEDRNSEEEVIQKSSPNLRLPNIGSDRPQQEQKNRPPPPPVYSKWKPSYFGQDKLPQSNNNQHPISGRPNNSKQPFIAGNIKGSTEIASEEDEKSSEEKGPEDDRDGHRQPPRKTSGESASNVENKKKPLLIHIKPSAIGQNFNKNETSSEEQEEDKSLEKNKDSEEQNDGDESKEDTKNNGSDEGNDKQSSTEDGNKSTEDDGNVKSEEKDNHNSDEQKSEEGSSEEKDNSDKQTATQTTQKPARVPAIEIATLGDPETSKETSSKVPPPPPVKLWAPSDGNLVDELESTVIEKLPVAFMKPPTELSTNLKPLPPTNPPRPITMVRSTPSPQQLGMAGSMGMGSGMGDGGNRGMGNRNKNKKKQKENENEKKESSEEKDSQEGDSEEGEDGGDDSGETSSEEVQDDAIQKGNRRNPNLKSRRVVEKFQFPNIGNPPKNGGQMESPPKLAIALPPIFKWRSRSGHNPKLNVNQRKGNGPNENENGHQPKVYKLSLSSEESSKSSSASIESTKGESSRREQIKMVTDTNNSKDQEEGSEEQISNTNNHNLQSQEIDSRRLEYLPHRAGGGESTIMISNKNRQFYSQPHSKKSQRGESQHRKAAPPLPPIFGKVGR